MQTMIVLYRSNAAPAADPPEGFRCQAEDTGHAEEQFSLADAEILWVYVGDDLNAALADYHEAILEGAKMPNETLYTWAQLETAACSWEHVLRELRRHREARNPWEEYREAYGMVPLRCAVIRHAPELFAAYEAALKNGYEKDFDRDFVPKYLEDHVTRILT